jgi:Flp pilus assembly protein TadG
MKRSFTRRSRGSAAALAFVGVIPLIAAFGGVAVDSMHVNDARGALQRATDAAALAGAQDLANYASAPLPTSATSVSSSNEEPLNYALQLASMNAVDGPIGLWQGSNRTVTATLRYDSTLGGVATRPNRCDVQGSIFIRSIFAQVFGNFGQTVSTTSSAGIQAINTLDSYLPLLVSWVDPDMGGNKLKDVINNSTIPYTIHIKDNKVSNSVWIPTSNKIAKQMIDYLGDPVNNPKPSPDDYPSYSIGDEIKSSNGIKSAGTDFAPLAGKNVGILVTEDAVSGYLAKGQPVHKVYAFVGMHIISYDNDNKGNGYSLTGYLYPITGIGDLDPQGPKNPNVWTFPFQARLIQ